MKRLDASLLFLLSLAALLVHGYHPFAEDAEIYLPGVEKLLRPDLFPSGTEFFQSHASLTLFPQMVAGIVSITHLPLEFVLLALQLLSIFLLLLACRQLTGKCFQSATARWAGVALVAALLTLPVAGTALYIMDQYLNPRNLAAFAGIFALVKVLEENYLQASLWIAFSLFIHPLMAAFALFYCGLLVAQRKFAFSPAKELRSATAVALLPFGLSFGSASAAYREAAQYHEFHYLFHWRWYEWLGILAPALLLLWLARLARARNLETVTQLCRLLVVYEVICFVAAVTLSVLPGSETLARLQPLRGLHLLYILLFLIGGGFLGEYVLKNRAWRWVALFLPLAATMFLVQRALFPASAHVELPGMAPRNPWAQAFIWVRENTPTDARFALDPFHADIPGEDTVGFRALAERSRLADAHKDSGAVSMFPPLATEWQEQMRAQEGWRQFGVQDFRRLAADYAIEWVVLEKPGVAGLDCPYENPAVMVCTLLPGRSPMDSTQRSWYSE